MKSKNSKKTTTTKTQQKKEEEYFTKEEEKRIDKIHEKTGHKFDDDEVYAMIAGKGRDTVRKNGDYSIMTDRDKTYHTWTSLSYLNPQEASNRDLCHQIAQYFAPILNEVYWPCSHLRAIPSFPSQLEWKIGLAWANTRGSLNSPS